MKRVGALCAVLLAGPVSLHAQSFCEPVTADTLVSPQVLGNGTPGSVTTAQIQAALNAGSSHIRFNIGASPTTITVTSTLTISRAVVLDGGGLVTLSGGNARRILQIAAQPSTPYSITLQNIGLANGNVPTGRGGAISNVTGGFWQRVSLKLVNVAFTDNAAMPAGQDDGGGAIYATGLDHVRIGGSTFTNNTGSNGGAVYSLGSRRVTIVDSVFAGNSATGTGANPGNGGNAGALGVDGADRLVDVCRTRFVNNTSNAHGAGFFSVMYDSTSRSRFEDVTFEGNVQISPDQHTGGAYIQDGPFALERVSFLRNDADGFGGLFVTGTRAAGTIRNCTFVGNVARTGLGGAMAIGSTSPVSIVNTTIASNVATAAFAGGISVGFPNQLRLTNVILANNTGGNAFVSWGMNNPASLDGGGNMQWPQNRPNGGAEVQATPTTQFANPLLAASDADNGGFVRTIALTAASPARDTGVSGGEVPLTDARGVPRVGAPDRGSYEFQQPTVSIGDVTLAEGNAGTTVFTFTLSLSFASNQTVSVNFATANGTAASPADYTATSGSRGFTAGQVSQTVTVSVVGETLVEANETFVVNLSGPTGATLGDAQGVGTIVNDDSPAASVNDVMVTEGDTGAQNASFTVSLSQTAPFPSSVNYLAAAGTATAGVDFGAVAGTVSFPAGMTAQTVLVPVLGDTVNEPNETFFVNLSGPVGATIGDGQGQGLINDNDAAGFTISDVMVRERVTPATATATFMVTLAPTGTATVNWATADGTATAGSDYVAGGGPLSFTPGSSTQLVTVTVSADALVEGLETFVVNLSGASGAAIAHGTGTAQVLDPPAGGDFNADNRNDLLWRHDVSGENVLWFMNGANLITGTFTTPPTLTDVRWKMVGTNDFNADGRPDILWRHSTSGENVLWYMNGSVLASGTFLTPSSLADVRWGMAGTGDFNVDGRPDILWRHSQSGEIVVWFMNGSVLTSGTFLTPSAFTDVSWQTVGTGDFNGDGKTDILWRHAQSGQNVVWFLEGTSLVSGAFTNPPDLADPGWRMVATSDYNFDGRVDIVWRHSSSGQNVMWFMNGIDLISGTFTNPSSLPDNNWKIVGPR